MKASVQVPVRDGGLALRAVELSRRYGDLTAVDRLSLEVRPGEILGFLGPNGAGKTTTLKMLCGLLRPGAGFIEIGGRRLRDGEIRGLRTIGVSPQSIVIWGTLTCLEQLEFMGRMYGLPGTVARQRAREMLSVFGLEEKTHRLGRTLSGGMQRRLNIALGLVHDPGLLFLDEPQAGLDPQSRVLVREYIRSLAGRVTVVVTTHDMEEAEKLAGRVCIIDHGRMLAEGTVAQLKQQTGTGDLFEIEMTEDPSTRLLPWLNRLGPELPAFTIRSHTLGFTSERGPGLLAGILQVIQEQNLTIQNLRVRPKTLEDVFIALTGRRLRE